MVYYCKDSLLAEEFRKKLPLHVLPIHKLINILEQIWAEACKHPQP